MSNPADNTETGGNLPESEKKNKFPTILFLILALLLIVSSVITCILLGNRTREQKTPGGDSFVIGGGEEPGAGQGPELHLAGRIVLADGTPLSETALEFHSEVKQGKTDRDGWFFFEDVEPGIHSLFVLDEKGKTRAEIKLDLSRNDTVEYSQLRIEKTAANQYLFHLAEEIRYLELDLELGEGVLTVRMDRTAAVDRDGLASLPSQEMNAKEGLILLPSGTVITRENQIIHGTLVVLPDNQVTRIPSDGLFLGDGTTVSAEGEFRLPDGTILSQEGIYNPVTNQTDRPGYPIQWKDPEANEAESGHAPPVQAGQELDGQNPNGTHAADHENGRPANGVNPSETTAEDINLRPTQPMEEPVKTPDRVESDDRSETLAPDYGDLGVYYEENGVWSVWKDERSIRLFDYMPGQGSTASSALPVIKPGSSGYYPFQVTNTFSSHTVKIRVSVTEETIHLPLSFRLVTEQGGQLTAVSDWSSPLSGSSGSVIVANANASPPGSTVNYHLEWRWPYEAGRDRMDTAAAALTSEQSRTYSLKLEINARR